MSEYDEPDWTDEPDPGSERDVEPQAEEDPGFEADVEPGIESTGVPEVDAALERLAELADRPVGEHAEVFDDVHQRLHAAMTDSGPSRPAGPQDVAAAMSRAEPDD